jgi:hypothetical protein
MWTRARQILSNMLVLAAAGCVVAAAWAAPQPASRKATANPKAANGAPAHAPAARGHAMRFRPARGAAAQDAARLGALIGKDCRGRADMPRNEHEWVVLCSNGKTFVVEPSASKQAATPPVECSLAGTGPEPACFP